jgi:MFS family permease
MKNEKVISGISSFFQNYSVAIAAFVIMMLANGTFYSFGVFFKPILNEFGWTRVLVSSASSFSWMISGLFGFLTGTLTDKIGPRLVMSICAVMSGTGYLLMSQADQVWQLYLFYGVLVGGGSAIFPPLVTTVARLYVQKRTTITGIVTVGIGLGSFVIPPLANELISVFDWRTSFIILGIINLIVLIAAAQFLESNKKHSRELYLIQSNTNTKSLPLAISSYSFKEALITRQFWIIFTMFFCMGYCVLTATVHIVPHATDINIMPSVAAGILSAIGGSSIIGRVVLGGVGDRIGNRNAFIIGFILLAIPMVCLIFSLEIWMLYMLAIIFGIGYGGCVASESSLVAAIFGLKHMGIIFGLLSTAFAIGAAVGPSIAGYIFDITKSYQEAFIITAFVGIIGLLLTIILSPIKRNP